MKKIIIVLFVLCLVACSNEDISYKGRNLMIGVIGETPKLENENIQFEQLTLEAFSEETDKIAQKYDAVMITPEQFEAASQDIYVEIYENSQMPIIFFNSNKRHYPFTRGGLTYEEAGFESLDNGSHTTVYLSTLNENREDVWFFYLENEKQMNKLYTELFQRIESL